MRGVDRPVSRGPSSPSLTLGSQSQFRPSWVCATASCLAPLGHLLPLSFCLGQGTGFFFPKGPESGETEVKGLSLVTSCWQLLLSWGTGSSGFHYRFPFSSGPGALSKNRFLLLQGGWPGGVLVLKLGALGGTRNKGDGEGGTRVWEEAGCVPRAHSLLSHACSFPFSLFFSLEALCHPSSGKKGL